MMGSLAGFDVSSRLLHGRTAPCLPSAAVLPMPHQRNLRFAAGATSSQAPSICPMSPLERTQQGASPSADSNGFTFDEFNYEPFRAANYQVGS